MVLDIHSDEVEEPLRGVMNQLGQENWRIVIEAVGSQMETLAPRFTLSQIFTELYVSGEDGYKGWTLHKLGSLVNWFREGNEETKKVKRLLLEFHRQSNSLHQNMVPMVVPLSKKAILVNEAIGKRIMGSDYRADKNSALIVIPYACFLPLMHKMFPQEPIIFYMTKEIPFGAMKNLFLINPSYGLEIK